MLVSSKLGCDLKMTDKPWKPTAEQLQEAYGTTLPDVIGPNLSVLLVGINPSLYSAVVGHHFARPGNRFWPALYKAGITDSQMSPFDDQSLLSVGIGITNVFAEATARADELTTQQLNRGAVELKAKIRHWRPNCVCFLGITTYRVITSQKKVVIGEQEAKFGGRRTWVLPNPSGLNAHYQIDDLAELFRELHNATQ